MTGKEERVDCTRRGWMIAAGFGALAFAIMLFVYETSFLLTLFWSLLLSSAIGLTLTFLFCALPDAPAPAMSDQQAQPQWRAEDADAQRQHSESNNVLENSGTDGFHELSTKSQDAASAPDRGPVLLNAPRSGGADSLQRIKGIGPWLERQLYDAGVFHYDQIAAWNAADADWIKNMVPAARTRMMRDDWIGQARALTGDAPGNNMV